MYAGKFILMSIVITMTKTLPYDQPNGTLDVYVGFYVESLGDVKETEMSFDADIYFRRSWRDTRLKHKDNLRIISDAHEIGSIWTPDLYFANAKTAVYHYVTVPNIVAYIEQDGTLSLSTRIGLTLSCNFDLRHYPLDRQRCQMRILSYGHSAERLNVSWFSVDAVTYNPDINLPQFYISSVTADYCNGSYTYAVTHHNRRTGNFSCLLATFELRRQVGYHLVQTYVPTAMIVMISWVSFWIDRTAVPARVSLSFTTLLTLSTLGAGLRYALPPVSYAKSIDYWYGMCMVFVFAALLEFALVNSLMRRAVKLEAMLSQNKDLDEGALLLQPSANFVQQTLDRRARRYSRTALHVDLCCRVAFPAAFASFNVLYWAYYLGIGQYN